MCHVINLIVQYVFDDIKEIISKIRNVWLFIGSSWSRIKLYKQTYKRLNVKPKKKIPQDVQHGWNSIYIIVCCYFYRIILDAYIVIFNALNPKSQLEQIEKYEWKIVGAFQKIFQVFYDALYFYLVVVMLLLFKQPCKYI